MLVAVTSGRRNTTASFIAQHFWDIGLVVDRFDNFEFFTECTFLKMGVLLYALRLLLFIAFFFPYPRFLYNSDVFSHVHLTDG